MKKKPGFSISRNIDDFLGRNITPPYVSNRADIRHVAIRALKATDLRLIMFSDGLLELYGERELHDLSRYCSQIIGEAVSQQRQPSNLALLLLRDALGGADEEKVSRLMTVEMTFRWMDDTTIIVQTI